MRITLGLMGILALGACDPVTYDNAGVVDPGTGVGFGTADAYARDKAAREAALASGGLPMPAQVSGAPLDATGGATLTPAGQDMSDAGQIAADARAALAATGSVQASPSNPAPGVVNSIGLSRENSFEAVGEERTIEQDAARIARNRAQYEMVQPEAIGERPGNVGPNIVGYALETQHPVGSQIYSRGGIGGAGRHERNCAAYASPDQAQLDFLRKGGPARDPMSLDPDGDGYACGWNPAPFRRARSN